MHQTLYQLGNTKLFHGFGSGSAGKRWLLYPVWQALLNALGHLRTDSHYSRLVIKIKSGLSTIIVWCYYVFGLSVCIRRHTGDAEVVFGSDTRESATIVVKEDLDYEIRATLMKKHDHG